MKVSEVLEAVAGMLELDNEGNWIEIYLGKNISVSS